MNHFTETVRRSADIVRVVSDYMSLKGTGSAFKGLCPFHSEKTPSFSVHREKQIFHCFGCGAGGDVFAFVMLAEKVSFPEAVRMVAEKCGVPIPAIPGPEDKKFEERQRLFEIYERAASYFHQRLPTLSQSISTRPSRRCTRSRMCFTRFISHGMRLRRPAGLSLSRVTSTA